MLRLKSLGQTLIEADDARLTPAAETVFATALYLIIEAGHPVGRDELTRLLWPGVSEARAQHGLRQALYRLKTLGAAIKADRSTLSLSPRFCTTDFAPLINPQSTSVLEALAETVSGGFLPGYRPQLSEEFASWVDRQRDVVHSAVARTLVAGIQAKKRVSDWNGAEQLASLCLTIDPLNEEATLTVAEAAALGGSKAKALSILNHYLKDIGEGAGEIKLPAVLLRRRISEAYQNNVFAVRDAPFVGREEEMAELTRALTRAQRGCGSAYVIWGEPGIGKTRLLSEFTRVAALQRLNIVRVGCQSHDVRRPLSAFVDLVPKLLALPGALGCSPESMRYLRRLIAHDPEEARDRESIEQSDISYESARIAIVDVLDAVSAETPCLLELEDAHWLDPQSIRMAHDIANWVISRRVLFLFTSRTTSIADERISPIGLRPLRTDASSKVARAFAREGNGAGEHYRSWCVSSSGGNPYYLIELLRNEAAQGHEYQAPASLARLLHARVMMLSADAKSLLEVCCVLGVHSTIERIATSIDIARPSLLRALAELDTSGMIEVEGSRVLSRHDLLSSVVLAQMSGAVKLMLHRYVAAHLETEADVTHSVSLIWESAEHWLSASDSARAIQLLRRCGNYLTDVGMPEEAARVLERAAILTTEPEEKYSIGAERARALMRAERTIEAAAVIDELLIFRGSIRPLPSPLDEVGVMSLQSKWMNCSAIRALVQEGLEALSSPATTPEQRVSAGRWLLTAADNLCDPTLGREVYESVAGDLRSDKISADARLWFEMVHHCCVGDRRAALDYADELAAYARRMNSPIVAMSHLRHASHVQGCHGSTDHALSLANEAFEIAQGLNAPRAMASSAGIIASLFMREGVIESADLWLKRAVEAYVPKHATLLDTNLLSHRIELAIREGQVNQARDFLTLCHPATQRYQAARSNARAVALETHLALVDGGRIGESELQPLVQLFEVVKRTTWQDYTAEILLLGLVASGCEAEARRVVEEFVAVSRRDMNVLSAPLAALVRKLNGKVA